MQLHISEELIFVSTQAQVSDAFWLKNQNGRAYCARYPSTLAGATASWPRRVPRRARRQPPRRADFAANSVPLHTNTLTFGNKVLFITV